MLIMDVQILSDWLATHPAWAGIAAFLIAFAETLPILGIIIPGSITMGAVGTLMGSGIIPMLTPMIYAMVGSLCGDVISYAVGFKFKKQIRTVWPFKSHPDWLNMGERFFQKHGGKSVFLGRYIGPLRSITPLIAGIMHMPFRYFFPISFVASIGWAPAYLLPGILIGLAIQEVGSGETMKHLIEIFLTTAVIIAAIWFIKVLCENFFKRHPKLSQLTLTALTALGFAALAYSVKHHGAALTWNPTIRALFQSLRTDWSETIAFSFTFLGDKKVIIMSAALFALWLSMKRAWVALGVWCSNLIVGLLLTAFLKYWVLFPRPPGGALFFGYSTGSFPSGHATLSTLLFGFAAVLIGHSVAKTRHWIVYVLSAIPVAFVVFSRLYLDVHWLTDIVGGVLLGLTIVQLHAYVYFFPLRSARLPTGQTIKVFIISVVIAWAWQAGMRWHQEQSFYITPDSLKEATIWNETATMKIQPAPAAKQP